MLNYFQFNNTFIKFWCVRKCERRYFFYILKHKLHVCDKIPCIFQTFYEFTHLKTYTKYE